jgi:hypothetical protein
MGGNSFIQSQSGRRQRRLSISNLYLRAGRDFTGEKGEGTMRQWAGSPSTGWGLCHPSLSSFLFSGQNKTTDFELL